VKEREEILIRALTSWLEERTFSQREQGAVITELAVLLLTHHRLLEAAQLLTCYGWICFQQGHAPRLARLVSAIKERFDWQATEDNACGGLLLEYLLSPYLGKPINAERRARDHQRIYDALTAGKVVLWPTVEIAVVQDLMMSALNSLRFEEAQALLDACTRRLAPVLPAMLDQRVSLLEKQAWVYSRWCEYAEEQQERQKVKRDARAGYRALSAVYRPPLGRGNTVLRLTTPPASGGSHGTATISATTSIEAGGSRRPWRSSSRVSR